jgi:hypothetical protein
MYRFLDWVHDWLTDGRADKVVGVLLVAWMGLMAWMIAITIIWAVVS